MAVDQGYRMERSTNDRRSGRRAALFVYPFFLLAAHAQSQVVFTVDHKASLAWWQVSPHLNHLWATTCPEDPSWYPGEGRSSGWSDIRPPSPKTGYANVADTMNVPLYPRYAVDTDCTEAVAGQILLPDTVTWRGARGEVTVKANAMVTGEAMRDGMMRQVLETATYPDIRFTLDSLVDVTRQRDTLFGKAAGTLTIRGQQRPTLAAFKAFPEGGGLRVLTKWHIPATDLIDLVPKINYLALGVHAKMWQVFFMGADVVLRREAPAAK